MLITKKDGLTELLESAKRYDIIYEFDNSDNVIVYHGTSQYAADRIDEEGRFQDGFFFHSSESFDNELNNYSEIRSKQKNETDGGTILKMLVDPRCLLINGAGETESGGDLYRDDDGVWKTEPYLKKNLPDVIIKTRADFEHDLQEELVYIRLSDELYKWLYNTFYYYYQNENLGANGSAHKLLDDIEHFENISTSYDVEDEVENYEDVEEFIEKMLEDEDYSYEDEDEVRENEELMIEAIEYKEFMTMVNMESSELSRALGDLDDDIIKSDLFVYFMNESNSVYSFKYFIKRKLL